MKNTVIHYRQKFIERLRASKLPILSSRKVVAALENVLTASFIRYLIIGFTSFGLDFGLFYILDKYSPIKALAANMSVTLVSLTFNFLMSNFWTFKAGKKSKAKKIKKYLTLAVLNYIFNNVTFQIVSVQMGVNGLLTKVFITATIVCWNFFLYKLWVFKNEQEQI